ncbi:MULTISPECIES: AzlC family ABC transporter permease [Vibrio]|uniref:AzlC family ABC transporter permease n=1 Tax=Vibrio TaxID=662 RepID=UPI0014820F35|nr:MULTISPECIES: AzlC family ABC transporter permease [Vibrio]NNN44967.1 AzlC family ABC transporter permease [Vibrio sp. 1-1(7)]NNN72340.1 AzlC family ABC transporter permease [Vibrio sp. 12-2(3-a)]
MSNHILSQHTEIESQSRLFWQGCLAMLPLSIAVLPWGLLAGSFAIDAGLTLLEGQALSAILFAGSAQLVAIGMMKTGAGLMTLLMTTFFITSRHFLYSVSMRKKISPLPLRWRLTLGFLLTDELFAICGQQSDQQFQRWYALGAGLSFYLCWNLATLVGIIAGQYLPALNELGLDFAVAATFIAIVIPTVKNRAVLVSILVALILSVGLTVFHVQGSLMIASIGAMLAGFFTEQMTGGKV